MKPVVRIATIADAQVLSAIAAETFALACPSNTVKKDLDAYIDSALTPKQFQKHISDSDTHLYTAHVGEDVVGYMLLRMESAGGGPAAVLELQQLYILPALHGKGIGNLLMETALLVAETERCNVVRLSVSKENERAIAFYKKHGFSVVGDTQFEVGTDIHEDFVMAAAVRKERL